MAFAYFDPGTFTITAMDATMQSLLNRFTALKSKYPGLQTWISIGGWSFSDPGSTLTAWSTMASSSSNRAAFISNLVQFMKTYGFDGVDLDWEYPGQSMPFPIVGTELTVIRCLGPWWIFNGWSKFRAVVERYEKHIRDHVRNICHITNFLLVFTRSVNSLSAFSLSPKFSLFLRQPPMYGNSDYHLQDLRYVAMPPIGKKLRILT